MKFRNILSLSAVALMSLGLTMGAKGLSASADDTGNNGRTPTATGNANVGPFMLTSATPNNKNQSWDVTNTSIDLGTFNLAFSNGTHSSQNYKVTPSTDKVQLLKKGSNYKNLDAKINGDVAMGKSSINNSYNNDSTDVQILLTGNDVDYGLNPNENDVSYSTVVNWNLTSSNPTNTGEQTGK